MAHRTRIEQQTAGGWVYHRPRCTCGWDGDIVRTRALANDQERKHLAEFADTAQTTLF